MKTGVLLLNLGTPDDTTVRSVRRYLREFLTDPRVIDLPVVVRYLLVFCAILPFRPFKTAKAYKKIWGAVDSPLRTITADTQKLLSIKLGDAYQVDYAMRYGKPSIASVVQKFKNCDEMIILPLFPQYSSAATGSAIEKVLREISKLWNIPKVKVINRFYNDEGFVRSSCENIKPYIENPNTFVLFSYHGLPERHIQKGGCKNTCQNDSACPQITNKNAWCYRAQCYETTRSITKNLGLNPKKFMTSFQSRLGKTPWITPYTDYVLVTLRGKGIKNLVIVSPSFVADCLETLEELAIGLKKQWLSLGGESLTVVPSLNTNALWIDSLSVMIEKESA